MSRLAPVHFAKLATLVLFGACGDGGTSPPGNGGTTTPVVSSVVISASEVTLTSLGDTVTLTAQASDASGNPVSGKTFTWASSNAEVATVSTTGLVTAVANGSVTITATTDAVNGTATVTVAQSVAAVVVTPVVDTLTALGLTTQLQAVARDAQGNEVPNLSFTWTSSSTDVASVAADGLATATGNGTATITATVKEVSGSAALTVAQDVESVEVTPSTAQLDAVGQTQQFSAEARDANANAVTGITFIWLSSDHNVATIDANGLAAATGSGSATITAAARGIPGTAALSVAQTAVQLSFSVHPTDAVAGAALSPAVQVQIQDANGIVILGANNSITLGVGTDPGGGTLSGTVTAQARDGIAVFAVLSIDKIGSGYTLAATSGDLAGTTSEPFDITAAAPDRLVISQQPAGADVRVPIGTVDVSVVDAFGNVVSSATDAVLVTLENHVSGGRLAGTTVASAAGGVASFSDLSVDRRGTDYYLTARSGSLGSATTQAFVVTFTWQGPLDSGGSHSCAVQVEGSVWCWGGAGSGQLGTNVVCFRLDDCVSPDPVVQTIGAVDAMEVSIRATCGRLAGDDWHCWGDAWTLGVTRTPLPTRVSGTAFLESLSVSDRWACGIATDQSAHCFGGGSAGELGNGTTVDSDTPVPVSGGLSFVGVTVGSNHACGLTTGGAAYCWGGNQLGQLGTTTAELCSEPNVFPFQPPSFACSTTPVQVDGGLSFQWLSAAYGLSCGVTTGNEAYCWGSGSFHSSQDPALGFAAPDTCEFPSQHFGSIQSRPCSRAPGLVGGGLSFSTVTPGSSHTCGLTTGGLAYCWGDNNDGRLGDGTKIRSTEPVAVSGGFVFGSLALGSLFRGSAHSCGFVPAEGEVYCWGDNNFGQLGNRDVSKSSVPVLVRRP